MWETHVNNGAEASRWEVREEISRQRDRQAYPMLPADGLGVMRPRRHENRPPCTRQIRKSAGNGLGRPDRHGAASLS